MIFCIVRGHAATQMLVFFKLLKRARLCTTLMDQFLVAVLFYFKFVRKKAHYTKKAHTYVPFCYQIRSHLCVCSEN